MTYPITPDLIKDKDVNRFWSKVNITANKDKCWNWVAGKRRRGYGRFSLQIAANKDRGYVATRVSYFINNNIDPLDQVVCHSCDNPSCVNPSHLFLCTEKDNTFDMMEKGRGKKQFLGGSNHSGSKLTEEMVLSIRDDYSSGSTQKSIASLYNVDSSLISKIISRKYWNHI